MKPKESDATEIKLIDETSPDTQFYAFLQDMIVPSTDKSVLTVEWRHIVSAYTKYCKALGQERYASEKLLALMFGKHIHKRRNGGKTYYLCTVRDDIFIEE